MASVNMVILIGNITRDAETRTAGQSAVARFGLATSEKFKDRNGAVVEETEFHDIELWGSEGVHQYLKRGQQVYVQGSIKTDKWTDSQNQAREKKVIKARVVNLLGGRRETSNNDSYVGAVRSARNMQQQERAQAPTSQPAPPPMEEDSDDLPF